MASSTNGGQGTSTGFDATYDVICVGSGVTGMVGALAAKSRGLEPLIVEKSEYFGGSSARSGGGVWAPNSPTLIKAGQRDDPAKTFEYMKTLAGDRVSDERIHAYLDTVPAMMEFVESQSSYLKDGFFWIPGYSDYHPDKGGNPLGRGIWPKPIDRKVLGDEMKYLHYGVKRMQLPLGAWITSVDLHDLLALRWKGIKQSKVLFKMGWRVVRARTTGERIGGSGQALVTRMRMAVKEHDIPLWRLTPMEGLITDDSGRVVGIEATKDGKPIRLGARHGVLIGAGGFDHNLPMREAHQPGITQDWSLGAATNTGDGILAGEALGAATDLMEDAWWMPTMHSPEGEWMNLVPERQYPAQFIVNGDGKRFVNESSPYVVFVQHVLAGQATGVSHIPSWYITDHYSWTHNFIAGHIPLTPMPKNWLESGNAKVADTMEELAAKIGVPPENLKATAARYNDLAAKGHDDDFKRGDSAYDNYYGDHSLDNPNLAPLGKGPYYAFALQPGDLGTKGGLMTDVDARVLRKDGSVIEGLYAAGNSSASVMGTKYAGPGASLGPAMVFGYLAGLAMATEAAAKSEKVG
ncbi:MAG TPA: FAD-binding protein [Solirubrobacterales bacterium]|nr:FAD-binding protein [Solirubrobacterales bacterium]